MAFYDDLWLQAINPMYLGVTNHISPLYSASNKPYLDGDGLLAVSIAKL